MLPTVNFFIVFVKCNYKFLVIVNLMVIGLTQSINYRLPLEVKPFRYWLEIAPDFKNDIYSGTVKIEVKAQQNASTITLHSNGLQIPSKDNIKVRELGTTTYKKIESVGSVGAREQHFYQIKLVNHLTVGSKYEIVIPNFTGQFSTDKMGFYYAVYQDEDGKHKTFATTQFEPCSARKAFPCFDEPALKAHFNIRIRRPSNAYHSISNTPKNESLSSDLLDVFKETDLMSTYLLAFIVSEMSFSNVFGKQRIVGTRHDIQNGLHLFSLNATQKAFKAMEEYTGIPYTFDKLDHASIPRNYFPYAAMENWGLIIYSETELMIPSNASTVTKQSMLNTISHEIVHQWFGNLVSPEWWEYLWLNEGFANYLQHIIADKIEPEMDIAREMVVDNVHVAMRYDGFTVTRPMSSPATDPNQIIRLFDIISYLKAGSVIRMLEHAVTPPVFRKGLNYYLNDRKYKSANPSQLYQNIQKALDESSPSSVSQNISMFMKTWERKAGIPLVTVTRLYKNEKNVILTQRRLFNTHGAEEKGNWIIPINFATASRSSFKITAPDIWLNATKDVITISNLNDRHWLIANKLQTGYYRVNYDLINWNLIIEALLSNYTQINAINRAQLLDDCAFLARSGEIPEAVNIRLQKYLVNEQDPIPLAVQQNTFRRMSSLLSSPKDYKYFEKQVRGVFKKTYDILTFDEKPDDTLKIKKLRANVVYWMCKANHLECKQKCLRMFRSWRLHGTEIPPDLQKVVLCGAMRVGKKNDVNFLCNRFLETKIIYFKDLYGSALMCVENRALVRRILEHTAHRHSSSLKSLLRSASESNKFSLEATLDFVPKHYGQREHRIGPEVIEVIQNLAMYVSTDHHFQALKQILIKTEDRDAIYRFENIVNDNRLWKLKKKAQFIDALKKYGFSHTNK